MVFARRSKNKMDTPVKTARAAIGAASLIFGSCDTWYPEL